MIIYYKMPRFAFLELNMVKKLQTLRVLLLFIITCYLYINESNKTIFSHTLIWKSLFVFAANKRSCENCRIGVHMFSTI